MNRACIVTFSAWLLASTCAAATDHAQVRVEHSKPLPAPGEGLGTDLYHATGVEKERTKSWKAEELQSGTPKATTLHGEVGRRISWFGIVREVREDKRGDVTRLLVEMKYFDGLTDAHQQIVSIYGAGDFRAVIPGVGHEIKRLALVRVYGTVTREKEGVPEIAADYVRWWDWGQFAFMDYGQDRSNPKWVKLRHHPPDEVYDDSPDQKYYEALLGKR